MNRTANIAALGYGAFALALWLSSMGPAGWFDPHQGNDLLPLALTAIGGCVLAAAGVLQWWRGHTLDSTLFIGFAAYWWIDAQLQSSDTGIGLTTPHGFLGWYFLLWSLLALCTWLTARHHDIARMLFSAGLCLALFADALAQWIGMSALTALGAYLALLAAIVAMYICAAELVNGTGGHTVLPLGESTAEERPGRS